MSLDYQFWQALTDDSLNLDLIEALIDNGSDVNAPLTPDSDVSPLFFAIRKQHLELIKLLVTKGANVNHRLKNGQTPLHSSVALSWLELVRLFLDRGARIDTKNDVGMTPLDMANYEGKTKMVNMMKLEILKKLTDELEQTVPLPWQEVSIWAAKVNPLIRELAPDLYDDFREYLKKPEFHAGIGLLKLRRRDPSISRRVPGDKDQPDNVDEQNEKIRRETQQINMSIAEGKKREILAFMSSIVNRLQMDTTQHVADQGKRDENMGAKIFIVHGHDNSMKLGVQLMLKNAGLDDVVLHEKPDRGRTVVEKLIEEGEDVCYAIALLSPDDVQADGKLRARQNVILEIGYFLGKLGREKVRLLKKGDVDIPSDLSGILYGDFDAHGAWRANILKEMAALGVNFDAAKAISSL